MNQNKKLFLLDAFALIFRGYYAFIKNPRITSSGMDVSAIMGFTNSLLELISKERPDYLAVAFDKGGSLQRVADFPEYKANRDETPEAIKIAVPYIQQILKAMHIPIIEQFGVEADDLIGTLAKQAEKEGFQVYMVTPDKDYAQLVSENIFMYRPARMGNGIEIWDVAKVQEKFDVTSPIQVIDYLAMMGDAVDNIPGLPGVGDKTARKFIAKYGSMENLLANTQDLKGKMKEKVEANAELGLLSKKLATIILDCDVTFDAPKYKMEQPNQKAVLEIFDTLEFRRIKTQFAKIFKTSVPDNAITTSAPTIVTSNTTNKVKKESNNEAGSGQYSLFDTPVASNETTNLQEGNRNQTLENTPHLYQFLDTPLALKLFLKILYRQKKVSIALQTTHEDPLLASIDGIAFSWEKGTGYYLEIPNDFEKACQLLKDFIPFFEDTKVLLVGQRLKYTLKLLSNYKIPVKNQLFDTLIAHYLINPDRRHDLEILSQTYLNYTLQDLKDFIGKRGKNQKKFKDLDLNTQCQYLAEKADNVLQLSQLFHKELKQTQTLDLFINIEIPLLRVLANMELEGVHLDVSFLEGLSKDLDADIENLKKEIFEEAGMTFNVASPRQLGEVLFGNMQLLKKPKKTKTGQYSTSEDVLSSLKEEHKIVRNVLEFRGLTKLKNTYIDALPKQVHPETKRIHTQYIQTVASTGRLSSQNPNLQNIPIRTLRGKQVRKAFVAKDENHVLLAADYSQIELRIIAALSCEQTMQKAFKEGKDIHAATASEVFNVPISEVTRTQRSHAKTVNFGIIYGVSAFGLSNQTSLSRSESKALIESYYNTYPQLKTYMDSQVAYAREHGYVKTILDRRRYLKDITSANAVVRSAAERNAVNAPIQGSAADIIKLAMIQIQEQLENKQLQTKMILQVHDELVFEVPKAELEEVKTLIKKYMERAVSLAVPLDIDLGIGENWLEAH